MLNATAREFRVSHLAAEVRTLLDVVVNASGTLSEIANACGKSVDQTEKLLGLLVDESLVHRTMGNREHATYRAA